MSDPIFLLRMGYVLITFHSNRLIVSLRSIRRNLDRLIVEWKFQLLFLLRIKNYGATSFQTEQDEKLYSL